MIYIETGSADPYFNFGAEYYFSAIAPIDDMVFLFWRTEPTLMLGKYQNPYEELNLKLAEAKGVKLVRRLSGGGTIYTDLGGWQFTFIDPDFSEEIEFKKYTAYILQALNDLGLDVTFTGRNDLLIDGRKISGNAQYQLNKRIIHHGSLLFNTNIEDMVRLTKVAEGKILSKSIKSIRERVTNVADHLDRQMTALDFKDFVVQGICPSAKRALTEEERQQISALAKEHFEGDDNIFNHGPKFSVQNKERFPAGLVEVNIEVKKGVIKDISFVGDFFATQDLESMREKLIGLDYRYKPVAELLQEYEGRKVIYDLQMEDLLRLIMA